ncbi:hypothetical protein [Nocardioides bruguierae]|uniref:Uncharacterized protein n=1 Tax=Nocardioides bruguierae TaxID=2945102 RepID=A0A9X2DB42_9ACTN|nr:hypothetical protein [Nocardioides bruguierae]MCM0622678.1 hypothetical protein [Nocardioides bruguierae]
MTPLLVALALLLWLVVPFPLAVAVGRAFARGHEHDAHDLTVTPIALHPRFGSDDTTGGHGAIGAA